MNENFSWQFNIADMNSVKEMEEPEDCFCVSKGRTKVCEGDKCHGNLS